MRSGLRSRCPADEVSAGILSRMNDLRNEPRAAAALRVVDEAHAEQRLDNYLMSVLKGVPRSHVYRIVRSGEVRVNSGRVAATYRVRVGDRVRIPPVRVGARPANGPAPALRLPVVFEDEWLLVIDKPAGLAVHGGSGVSFGAIEALRAARPEARFLELAHRLDRETSGLLMIAKKRSSLLALHAALRAGRPEKRYLTLVKGNWKSASRQVTLGLRKYLTAEGERRVAVDRDGRESRTRFELVRSLGEFSLLAATIATGRTHQIRVQLAHLGFPVAGDDKYGDFELNKGLAKRGLKRMFLHAAELRLAHPVLGTPLQLAAPLPADLSRFLASLESSVEHAAV